MKKIYKTVKEKSVCKGCKYYIPKSAYSPQNGSCDYAEREGHSRLKIEMKNGGYRTDSCPCYEKGERKRRKVQPIESKRVFVKN